jgi:MoaA/NifB/PqqE/SkfB family radical SAM enzyme
VSLDGATQAVYSAMRPGASLNAALKACRAVREAGLPLEVTFAPTRLNIGQADRVLDLALELGAFRFNSGRLMRVGTAARLWDRLEPSASEYAAFFALLEAKEWELSERMELCFKPSSLAEALREAAAQPPAALLVLPNGKVKASAALPFLCADLRTMSLKEAWGAYQAAWTDERVLSAASALLKDPSRTALSNRWIDLTAAKGPRSPERGSFPLAKGAAPKAARQARPPAGSRATVKETR